MKVDLVCTHLEYQAKLEMLIDVIMKRGGFGAWRLVTDHFYSIHERFRGRWALKLSYNYTIQNPL